MLKYYATIFGILISETPKELMAAQPNAHGEQENNFRYVPVIQDKKHQSKTVRICLDLPQAYAAKAENEVSALPIWTRVPTSIYEDTHQGSQEKVRR